MKKINEHEYESPIKIKAYDPVAKMTHHFDFLTVGDMHLVFTANTHIECEPEDLAVSVESPPAHMYTLEELREMDGKPVYIVFKTGVRGWAILAWGKSMKALRPGSDLFCHRSGQPLLFTTDRRHYWDKEPEIKDYGAEYMCGWVAYDRPPEEG